LFIFLFLFCLDSIIGAANRSPLAFSRLDGAYYTIFLGCASSPKIKKVLYLQKQNVSKKKTASYHPKKRGEKVPRRRVKRAKVPRDLQSRPKKKPPKDQRLANRRRVDLITTQDDFIVVSIHAPRGRDLADAAPGEQPEPGKNLEQR
jgi:hypothetical protein